MLFNRAHSGTTLTTAGDYLLPHAQKLLADAAETREGLAGFRTGYHDRLRMASVLGPLQSWLPVAIAEFAQLYPHVQLQVRIAPAVNDILTQVAAGESDLGVVSLRPSAPARPRHDALEQTVILDEDLVVLAPAGHSLAQLAYVGQADLRETPLILFPPDYYVRQITEDWTRRGGYAPIVAAELGTIEAIVRLVIAGVGVAIVPRSLARLGLASGLPVLSFDPDDSPRRIVAAVYMRQGRAAELVRSMLALMETHAREASRR